MDKIQIKVNRKKYECLAARTENEREQGLQGVEDLPKNEGCFFFFPKEQDVTFWMKDTPTPLLIVFIDKDLEVISTANGQPNSEAYIDEKGVKYVLEVNQGEDIEEGDVVEILGDEDTIEMEPNKMYVIGPDGNPQAELVGGERIFSRISTKVILRKANKAAASKKDSDYISLGRYVFNELSAQEERDPQYVESKTKD